MNERFMYSYRMTTDEYSRLLFERDELAEEYGTDSFMSLLRDNEGTWVNDPMHGRSMYDAGWYLVRTNTLVDWI